MAECKQQACKDGGHRRTPLNDAAPSTGESLEVAGTPDGVGKLLQDAVRSSPGTLAWLQDADSDEAVGVNPAHVVAVTPA